MKERKLKMRICKTPECTATFAPRNVANVYCKPCAEARVAARTIAMNAAKGKNNDTFWQGKFESHARYEMMIRAYLGSAQ